MRRNAVWLLRRDRLLRFPASLALAVPTRPAAFLRSPLFSWAGKLRMALEPFAPPAPDGDESVAAFLRRRLGPEAVALETAVYRDGLSFDDACRKLEQGGHGAVDRARLRDMLQRLPLRPRRHIEGDESL